MKDKSLLEGFLAAKEHINICNSIIDEEVATAVLRNREKFIDDARERAKTHFKIVSDWMQNQRELEYIKPEGGLVCLSRIKFDVSLNTKNFYETLTSKYKTFVGPGHWFDTGDRYFRIGYGWPTSENLEAGLNNIARALEEVKSTGS